MAIIPTARGRFHFARLVHALQVAPHSLRAAPDALRMAMQLRRSLWVRPSRRRLLRTRYQLKWARDEHHAEVLRQRLPARLRRHVVVESYED